jgi:5-deoxy-glucuronate isomerase
MTEPGGEPEIHAAAAPNDLSVDALLLRPDERGEVSIDPASAGWRYLSYRTRWLTPDDDVAVGGPALEAAVVLLAGADAALESRSGSSVLAGRRAPLDDLPSAWYVPAGARGRLRAVARGDSRRTLVAIAEAPLSGRGGVAESVVVIRPPDVRIEIRGAGNATRQVNHIIAPDFPADRLEVVEVVTPSGNWSSWPPHKHDVDAMPGEAVLEEIYWYAFRRPAAWAVQRLYRPDRSRDGLWEVRDGEVVLVTDGYHPFAAAHGDDAYYLNALAGDRRTMACSFDPDWDWVRATWASMAPDPRVPLVPPRG